MRTRNAQAGSIESGHSEVAADGKRAVPPPGELHAHIDERHGPAGAACERTESGDLHRGQLASMSRQASHRARSASAMTSLRKGKGPGGRRLCERLRYRPLSQAVHSIGSGDRHAPGIGSTCQRHRPDTFPKFRTSGRSRPSSGSSLDYC